MSVAGSHPRREYPTSIRGVNCQMGRCGRAWEHEHVFRSGVRCDDRETRSPPWFLHVTLERGRLKAHGGAGVLRFFEYIAERTDVALGMFNSRSSGYVLTPAEMAAIYRAIPAVVAVKEGVQDSIMPTLELHALVPELLIWECDFM